MSQIDDFLSGKPSGSKSEIDGFLGEDKPKGGFGAAAKQAVGAVVKGAGQAVEDFAPDAVGKDNAIKRYGQGVIDANPTAVTSGQDILDSPWTAVKEAVGNAAGSMGPMLGARALGMGVTAAAPLTGPFAPATALAGQAIANVGPFVAAALPSFGGIREKQIEKDPNSQASTQDKAVAALGAGTVGLIEGKFGPQAAALKMMTKQGRDALAKQFAETTLAKGIGYGALKGAAVEGAEELVQNPVEQLASYQDPRTPENVKETLFGGAMGAIGGGVLGGGVGAVNQVVGKKRDATVTPQPADTQPADPLLTGNTPDPYLSFADGTVARKSEIDAYIGGLPKDQQPAARAKIMGLAPQPADTTDQASQEATASLDASRDQAIESGGLVPDLPAKPSEAMGLAPTAGPSLANAAILSVDTGIHQAATEEADPYNTPLSALGQELSKTNQRLRQEADALGLDTEGLHGDAARMTDGKPHEDYLMAANDQLRKAMKAAKEIPDEGRRGYSDDPARGGETKGPDAQASKTPSTQGAAPAVGDTSAPVGTAVATEPWKMTRKEYAQQGGDISYSSEGSGSHRGFVEAAVSRGETISPEVLKDYPWIAADQNIKPYADGLRNLSDNELRSEEKRATDALNKWANKTPAINKDGGEISINPQLHTVDSFEVSARFNAVNNEIERRKDNPNEAPTSGPVAPEAKAPKQNALQKRVQKAQQARADYFTPGNIVKSYSGHDRVIGYTPPVKDGGNWSVRVQSVVKQGDKWVNDPKDNRERQHSTPPDAKELASGPVFRNPVQPQGATREPQADQAQQAETQRPQEPAAAAESVSKYTAPGEKLHSEWGGYEVPAFSPTPRQQVVMDAVARALDKGVFYSDDMTEKVAADLGVVGEELSKNTINTQGGDFGMDVYYARKAVEAQRGNQKSREIADAMNLKVGEVIGTLITQDFKQTTGVKITAISETGLGFTIEGKRGAATATGTMGADAIKNAIDRAKEKGRRKDGYAEFIAARAAPVAPAAANPKIKEAPDKKNEADAEPVAARTATEHAGLKIYPTKVKVGAAVVDMWGVQTKDNARREKNGERQIGGDPLSETLDGAKKNAEAEVRDAKSRAEREAESKAADEAAQAKKDANKGKSIIERKRDSYLDKQHTYPPQAGLGQGTRREAMQKAVDQGRAIVERMVPDTAAKHRDQTALDLVRARGYILGLSNENIPVVKQGLEAQARMKANQYEKPEYRVYDSAKTDGGFREISKTEFDYAKSLEGKPGEPSSAQTSPVTNPANEPTAEQIAAIGDITIEVPTENGTAKMTVNAAKALAHIDERMDALEMVQRCLG